MLMSKLCADFGQSQKEREREEGERGGMVLLEPFLCRGSRFCSTIRVYDSLINQIWHEVVRSSVNNATFFVRRISGLTAKLASQIRDNERFIQHLAFF